MKHWSILALAACGSSSPPPPEPLSQTAPVAVVVDAAPLDACELVVAKMMKMYVAAGATGEVLETARANERRGCTETLAADPGYATYLACVLEIPEDARGRELRTCVQQDQVRRTGSSAPEYVANLRRIGDGAARVQLATGKFPVGAAGLSPVGDPTYGCCKAGASKGCPVVTAEWDHPVWKELGFAIDPIARPLFQYGYQSRDGTSFTVLAVGDLDCDLKQINYRLEGRIVNGQVQIQIIEPPRNSD